jgi:nitrogen fixation uncharacterized protein
MAIEDAVRFLVRASTDAALKSRLDRSKTPSSVVALAKEPMKKGIRNQLGGWPP